MKFKISLLAVSAVLLCGALFISCGPQGKYAEVEAVAGEFVSVIENLDKVLDSNDSKKVAAALTTFTARMKELEPRLEEMGKKFPELNNDKLPAELESMKMKMDAAEEKFKSVFEKLIKYSKDPEVMKAMQEMMQ